MYLCDEIVLRQGELGGFQVRHGGLFAAISKGYLGIARLLLFRPEINLHFKDSVISVQYRV